MRAKVVLVQRPVQFIAVGLDVGISVQRVQMMDQGFGECFNGWARQCAEVERKRTAQKP